MMEISGQLSKHLQSKKSLYLHFPEFSLIYSPRALAGHRHQAIEAWAFRKARFLKNG
jgi:hypothetical protein